VCRWSFNALAACTLLLVYGCKESLPLRSEPEGALTPSLTFQEGVIEIRGDNTVGLNGAFDARLRNSYSEVLEGPSRINGTIEVWLRDRPDEKATIPISPLDLQNLWIISGNTVTLTPGDAARFYKQWNHKTDDGTWFWELVDTTHLVTPDGTPYADSDSVNILSMVSLQVFDQVPVRHSVPDSATLLYRIY
jgi:hypothetical protein